MLTQTAAFEDSDGRLVQIRIRASGLRVAGLVFKAESGKEIALLGTNENGTWTEFNLKPDERLIGCCGYLSGNQNLVGLGFILWSQEKVVPSKPD